jgi:hypothetical protein
MRAWPQRVILDFPNTGVTVIRGTQMENFCPRCGESRIGAFRFCRMCRFDFDTLDVASRGQPAGPPSAAALNAHAVVAGGSTRGHSGQSLLGMGVLMLVGIAALGGIQRIDPEIVSSGATPTQEIRTLAEAEPQAMPVAPNKRAAEPRVGLGAGNRPTAEPTPKHAPKPKPKATPKSTPRAAKTQPGIFGNPWGYDFQPGKKIANPPARFCDYFDCVSSFWDDTKGVVVQCRDGAFSQSGGRQDGCSDHGGYRRTLHRH